MVRSQFWIRTVVRVTSITSPSAFCESICTQSPTWIRRLAFSWIPATSPRMVSRKISRMTAIAAPIPESRYTGDRENRTLTSSRPPSSTTTSLPAWVTPRIENFDSSPLDS